MLDGNNPNNLRHIIQLRDLARGGKKPIVFWIGAGASKWCGYLLWDELADKIHSSFIKREPQYDRTLAGGYLNNPDFPALFDHCKRVNPRLYYSLLAENLAPRTPTPVYKRFLDTLSRIGNAYILTTNVDETLEKQLSSIGTIQLTDIEQSVNYLQQGTPFICKLHGTSSAIQSAVFTTTEYSELCKNKQFLWTLENIFAVSSVVFIGYSLRDQYVLESLVSVDRKKPIFGAGPHFAVVPSQNPKLPESILQLTYSGVPHKDHRSAIDVIDIIRSSQQISEVSVSAPTSAGGNVSPPKSSFYISDFTLPGTWTSSQNLMAKNDSGLTINFVVGQGFTNNELPSQVSTALHDLAVGLICFDVVYFPLSELFKVCSFLGDAWFWAMIDAGAIEFVHLCRESALIYENGDRQDGGDLGMVGKSNPGGAVQNSHESIRAQLHPIPGRESIVEPLIDKLQLKVSTIPEEVLNAVPTMVRGCLLGPQLRVALGMSDGVLPTAIPRWNAFPVLRLAHLVTIGTVCQQLGIGAAKIAYGGECLVGPAFSQAAAHDWADQIASYTLSGRFNSDLGAIIANDNSIFGAILRFRDTSESQALRREIHNQLDTNASSDFVASVNAGINRVISPETLEKARDQIIGLLFAGRNNTPVIRAVWNNFNNSDSVLKRWRKRSANELCQYCRTYGIRPKDLCPCRSGERLRDCCANALGSEYVPD